ncbi:hypothetical protein QWZ10_25735 [Paracoccus cavernae]|uniref:Uncharacterized protein n=1 Tax=Paracoccus cavernae TaxID=1571207 RepID=A0ABT8DDU5_9RHOB|nr:hypothetical protein [Paracoccus cavernae]
MDIDPKTTASTFELRPNDGEMLKPAELVEVDGAEKLTLNARRAYNLLLHNAHGPDMAVPHQRFTIPLADLKFSHAGNDRLTSAIKSLMRTIVTIRSADRVELVPYSAAPRLPIARTAAAT